MIMDPPCPDTGSVEHPEVVPLPASPPQSYEQEPEQASAETDALLPTGPAPAADSANEKTGVFSRLTGAPVLRYISFDYPTFAWQRLGRVRLPEDEEASPADPPPPSRFAGCWANIKKRQCRLRWWHYLLILFVVLSATVPPIVVIAVRHARRRSWNPAPRPEHVCYRPAEFTLRLDDPRPRFGRQEYLHKATTSFGIRADAPYISLSAQDSHGRVRFVLDNSTAVRNRNVTVDITAYMDDWNTFRNNMVVCRGGPWSYASSVGTEIYSKGRWRLPHQRSAFDITVRLPAGSDVSPVALRSVIGTFTDMEVVIEDLQDLVTFDSVNLVTQNAPVHVESLTARSSVMIIAANAPLSGSFKTPTLRLSNTNGEVTANATLTREPAVEARVWGHSVHLSSSNRAVTANVVLPLQRSSDSKPYFPITLETSNAPVTLNVSAPAPAGDLALPLLGVSTRTTYAPSAVLLPGTYTGAFSLDQQRGWQQPHVHFDEASDPARRTMRIDTLGDNRVSGELRVDGGDPTPSGTGRLWGPMSWVNMQATNGDLDLYL